MRATIREMKEAVVEHNPVKMGGLGLHLIKNPAGTFSFKGRVPVTLAWLNKDGSELSLDEAWHVSKANYPAMLAKTRVFESAADALDAAEKLGVLIDSIDEDAEAELHALGLLDDKDYEPE